MRSTLLLSLVLLSGCYNPQLPAGKFVCTSSDQCPAHLVCGGGLCVDPVGQDLAGQDLTGQDLTGDPADLRPDPCAAGWIDVSAPNIYACRRAFSFENGNWGSLCRGGFHVCEAPRDNTILAQASGLAAKCSAAGRFFMARIDATISNPDFNPRQADANCAPMGSGRGLLGCGSDANLYALRNGGCSSLVQAMGCQTEPSGWRCDTNRGINGDVSNNSNQGGLLCCKD